LYKGGKENKINKPFVLYSEKNLGGKKRKKKLPAKKNARDLAPQNKPLLPVILLRREKR